MGSKTRAVLLGSTLLAAGLWLGNTSLFSSPDAGATTRLIAVLQRLATGRARPR